MSAFVAVRVRGTIHVARDIRETLEQLRLRRPNHAVVVPKDDSTEGMLRKARDYIAYGEVDAPTLEAMLKARGRLAGDHELTDAYVQEKTEYPTIEAFAAAVVEGSAKVSDLAEAKPVLRLNPPRGGFGTIKRHYPQGALGYWGGEINLLVRRMV